MKRGFALAVLCMTVAVPLGAAHAASDPSVASFTVQPAYVNYGQPINIAWTLNNAGGHSIVVSCPLGVVLRYTATGAAFPCNTHVSVSTMASDSVSIIALNDTGVTKQPQVTIIPKDGLGNEYALGQQTASFGAGTNPNPITAFTVATSSVSGATVTVSWTAASEVPGANFIVGCDPSNSLTVASPSLGLTRVSCGFPISSTDLPASGSVTLVFTSTSAFDVPFTLTVMPAIVAGTYDATHAVQVPFTVTPAKKVDPTVLSFTAPSTDILSGVPVSLSWTTQNSNGENIRFDCNENISIAKVVNQATTTVACSNLLYDNPLTTGSATVVLTNTSYTSEKITAWLLPTNAATVYMGARAKSLTFTVRGAGVSVLPVSAAPVIAQASATTSQNVSSSAPVQPPKKGIAFTKYLGRGMRNSEVAALQKFFASDPKTYGSVTVSGLFGPATEKLVMQFQIKYGIARKGGIGYGTVGPATRAKLNSLAGI